MQVLVDEPVPRRFARLLTGHKVQTVQLAGWSGLKNGELLRTAVDAGYEVFLTVDRRIPYQQTLSKYAIGVIILLAPSNRFSDLEPLLSDTLAALAKIRSGDVVRVGA